MVSVCVFVSLCDKWLSQLEKDGYLREFPGSREFGESREPVTRSSQTQDADRFVA